MAALTVVLGVVAAVMALVTAVLIQATVEGRSRARAWIALYLLAMMGEMWIAAVVYLNAPSLGNLVAGIAVSGVLMVVSVVPLVGGLLRHRGAPNPPTAVGAEPVALGLGYAGLVAGLVLVNEFLMSWGLLLAQGASSVAGGSLAVFAGTVNSPWFVFTMAAEMFLTAAFLWRRLPRALLAVLLVQAAIMVFTPTALGGATWPALAIYVSSALMIGLFVFLFEYLYRHRQFTAPFGTYLVELVSVYGLMMAGLFVWQYFGDATAFALAIVLEMVVVYVAVSRPRLFQSGPSPQWQLRPAWTFALLSGVFVAEVCMGAALSVQLDPADYLGGFPFLPLAGTGSTILLNALSNGFWFFATAAASTWFLVMMGLEMGALVVFKFRETN